MRHRGPILKANSKKLDVKRRHNALTGLDRMQLFYMDINIVRMVGLFNHFKSAGLKVYIRRLIPLIQQLFQSRNQICLIDSHVMWAKRRKPVRKWRTIDSFSEDNILPYFRFKTKQQLHRLRVGFRIPDILRTDKREKFTGDEVLLVGLRRLAFPNRTFETFWETDFGLTHHQVSKCFGLFLIFMMRNWAYLLLDHMEFWKPYMQDCADKIRMRLATMGCYFLPPGTDGGFNIFGFIDNTMNATCRPGGGPARDGKNAPRNDPLIQQAWYNGWKKIHGLKWQTIDLPNGMNFHVYGPISVRRNDLTSARWSRFNAKLDQLQANDEYKYVVYGDSAYLLVSYDFIKARHNNVINTPRQVLENRALSSCRETIEWDYGDIGRYWAFLDYKHVLKMRVMSVGQICLTAMILRNAHAAMNGCNTSESFMCIPPSFEEWISAGPRYVPLPSMT